MRKLILGLLCVMLAAAACKNSDAGKPDDFIKEEKMRDVLRDVLTAEARISQAGASGDSMRTFARRLYGEIYMRHNITREQFLQNMNYYTKHPDIMERNFQPIIDSLSALEARTQ